MSLNSVNSNVGAMIALQNLNSSNAELARTRQRISTGFKVSSTKDNGAVWAIAQGQRGEQRALDAVIGSIQRGQSVVDVAIAAGETISGLLVKIKQMALPLLENDQQNAALLALSSDYLDFLDQIDAAAASASFAGMNLISSGGADQVKALANTVGSETIDLDHVDLSTDSPAINPLRPDGVGYITIADIDFAIASTNAALAKLGTGSKALEAHLVFVRKQQDTVQAGIGRLVDADLARESARLQSERVKQELAVTALGVANSGPSMLLQLLQ
ncbi:MAG: flagellin [Caulobacter sp.]|nr:flagellin [Caulobacter sp.]